MSVRQMRQRESVHLYCGDKMYVLCVCPQGEQGGSGQKGSKGDKGEAVSLELNMDCTPQSEYI